MELLLTLPIFLMLLFGLLEYSLLFFAQADVTEAARAGARQAALRGATSESVEVAVLHRIGPKLWTGTTVETQLGENPGDEVIVKVRAPMRAASPDLLWVIGYSLKGRELVHEVVMAKE